MSCATCQHYHAHKRLPGVGLCDLMRPRSISGAEQPALIAASQPCYLVPVQHVARAA